MAAQLGSCPVCSRTLARKANWWITSAERAERVCHVCHGWAARTLEKLRYQKMVRIIFP